MSGTPEIRLDGDVAIVTGAGSGLGRSYALALAARGASVVCNDIEAERAASTATEIAELGGTAVAETSSVASADGGAAIVQAAVDAFGSVEILVNNAGQLRNAAFEEMTVDDFRAVLDTHLAGAFFVTQPAFRHMKAAGYGRILFTSSAAGAFGAPWQANYGAAKAGLIGLSNVVALEGAPHGITANAIMPMSLDTGIKHEGPPPYSPEGMRDMTEALRPIARHMVAANVAPVVVYLASRSCTDSHRVFSVGAGRVASVFVGTNVGWFTPGLADMTPERVADAFDTVRDLSEFSVPEHLYDELHYIADHMP